MFFEHNHFQSNVTVIKVTVPNIPYLGVRANVAYDNSWYECLAFDTISAFGNGSPFTQVTVHEFVWGYNSSFLKWLNDTVGNYVPGIIPWFYMEHNCTSEDEARYYFNDWT